VLHTLAPQELRPALEGDLRLLDSEGGQPVEISANPDLLRRYDAGLRAWQDEIERLCGGLGMLYLPVDTGVPVQEFVLSSLRQRGVLR
jgi:hypothetical protein